MNFPAEIIKELDYWSKPIDGFEFVSEEILGTHRWGNENLRVFRAPDGELYGIEYRDTSGDGYYDYWGT